MIWWRVIITIIFVKIHSNVILLCRPAGGDYQLLLRCSDSRPTPSGTPPTRSATRRREGCSSASAAPQETGWSRPQSLNDSPPPRTYRRRPVVRAGWRGTLGIGEEGRTVVSDVSRAHGKGARAGTHVLRRNRGRWPETFWFGSPRTARPQTAATPRRARTTRRFNECAARPKSAQYNNNINNHNNNDDGKICITAWIEARPAEMAKKRRAK